MSAHKIIGSFVAVAALVAGAVAVARSSADTNISTFPKTRVLDATCPKIEWPYGCAWRSAADLRKKKSLSSSALSARSRGLKRFSRFGIGL